MEESFNGGGSAVDSGRRLTEVGRRSARADRFAAPALDAVSARRADLPLPVGVACFAIAGSTGGDAEKSNYFGDGLVPVESALARARGLEIGISRRISVDRVRRRSQGSPRPSRRVREAAIMARARDNSGVGRDVNRDGRSLRRTKVARGRAATHTALFLSRSFAKLKFASPDPPETNRSPARVCGSGEPSLRHVRSRSVSVRCVRAPNLWSRLRSAE